MLLSIQGAPRLDVWPKAPLWAVDCWAHNSFLTAPPAQGKGMTFSSLPTPPQAQGLSHYGPRLFQNKNLS